jgi:16S rRNA (guanine527-N7)-methyltransferase
MNAPALAWSLPPSQIEEAVANAGLTPLGSGTAEKFSNFADLLGRWNARLNLTAIRSANDILQRHFIECIFCAQSLPSGVGTLLDFGSGAGFPGIPVALCRREIRVTLGESQAKKSAFLQEAVRTLGLSAEVFDGRVELMEATRMFDVVAMRAVDKMELAIVAGSQRVAASGFLALMTTVGAMPEVSGFVPELIQPLPGSTHGILGLLRRE